MFTHAPIVFLDETTSTNDEAAKLIADGNAIDGTLIQTNFQVNGRGQRGSTWESLVGQNLLMSVIILPKGLAPGDAFLLNMCVALGVYDFITLKVNRQVGIKWPNDILVDKQKIAGILIENTLRGRHLATCIAGVGVNLNQKQFNDSLQRATSLYMQTGSISNIRSEAMFVRDKIGYWYQMLCDNNRNVIYDTYHQRLFGLNKLRDFNFKGAFIQGYIRGVDASGRLVIEKTNQEIIYPEVKELEYLWE